MINKMEIKPKDLFIFIYYNIIDMHFSFIKKKTCEQD